MSRLTGKHYPPYKTKKPTELRIRYEFRVMSLGRANNYQERRDNSGGSLNPAGILEFLDTDFRLYR